MDKNNVKPLSDTEKSGLAKKKAINRAASYFSDDDSLFEFEGFEIEELAKDIDELNKKDAILNTETANAVSSSDKTAEASDTAKTDSYMSDEKPGATESDISKETLTSVSANSEESAFGNTSTETEDNTFFDEKTEENSETEENGFDGTVTPHSQTASVNVEALLSENEEGTHVNKINDENTEETDEINTVTDNLRTESSNENVSLHSETLALETDNEQPTKPKRFFSKYTNEMLARSLETDSPNAEGQIRFEGTESEFFDVTEETEVENSIINETENVTQIAKEEDLEFNEETSDDLYDEDDLDNEIWDRAGKEEWEQRESFINYCRSLTLPPIKAGNYGIAEQEPVKSKSRPSSSGYRYAESERIPVFSDGMHGGVDKAGYAERERRYCENRRSRQEIVLREKTRSLHRTVLYTALILLTVFFLEILNSAIGGQGVLFASIEIGLTVLGAAFIWKALCDGLRCAVKGVFIPELLAFLTVLLSLVYSFITIFAPLPEDSTVLIGIPAAVAIFLTALYRSLMSKREKKVFDITAEYGNFCTEVRLASFKGSPEEIAFGGYASEDGTLYKTNRIQRADGGYNIQPVRDECFGLIKILLICIICAAVASGIAFGFIKRDVYYGIFSAYMLVSLACPLCVFLSLALPRFITAEEVAEDGATITDFDDESDEFDENVIMIREEELFPPENIKIIDTYWSNSHFLETHLSRAAAAFRKTGGLLSGLFSNIDLTPESYREVVITDISDSGITVKVDDSLVRAGTDEYLEKHGIEIVRYPDIPKQDTGVLYIANNGEFFARITIRFIPDERLCRKMAELRQADTLFSLKTCNPCINSALVFYTTGLEPELLRVVKYMVEDDVSEADTDREGILVSKTGAYGLFSALLGYKRQKKLVLLGSRIAALSGLLGVLLALAVSLTGIKWKFISFAILGFHLITSGVAAFIGSSGKKHANNKRR